jgi:hypothetical protein
MKRTIPFLLICFLISSAFGQITTKTIKLNPLDEIKLNPFSVKEFLNLNQQKISQLDNSVNVELANFTLQNGTLLDSLANERFIDSTETWRNNSSQKLYYDSNNNQYLMNFFQWNPSLNYWYIHAKTSKKFNSKDNLTENETVLFDENSTQSIPYYKIELFYDLIGNMIQEIHLDGNDANQWKNSYRYDYEYDYNNRRTQKTLLRWDRNNNKWNNSNNYEYFYDSLGNKSQEIRYNWVDTLQKWNPKIKTEFTYSPTGKIISENSKDYSDSTDIRIESKISYTYDEYDNLIEEFEDITFLPYYIVIGDEIHEINEPMENNHLDRIFKYSYDENGNLIKETWFDYDYDADSMLVSSYYEYSYDDLGNRIQRIGSYKNRENIWITSEIEKYFYKNPTSSKTLANRDNMFKIYPNPANDVLVVNLNTSTHQPAFIEIYDLKGKKVYSEEIKTTKEISVIQFNKGIYICKMILDGKSNYEKLIIK